MATLVWKYELVTVDFLLVKFGLKTTTDRKQCFNLRDTNNTKHPDTPFVTDYSDKQQRHSTTKRHSKVSTFGRTWFFFFFIMIICFFPWVAGNEDAADSLITTNLTADYDFDTLTDFNIEELFTGDSMHDKTKSPTGSVCARTNYWRLWSINAGLAGIRATPRQNKQSCTKAMVRWTALRQHALELDTDVFAITETGINTRKQEKQIRQDLLHHGYQVVFSSGFAAPGHSGVLISWKNALPYVCHNDIEPGRALKVTFQGKGGSRIHVHGVYGFPGNISGNTIVETISENSIIDINDQTDRNVDMEDVSNQTEDNMDSTDFDANRSGTSSRTLPTSKIALNKKLLIEQIGDIIKQDLQHETIIMGDFNLRRNGNKRSPQSKEVQQAVAAERLLLDSFMTKSRLHDLLRRGKFVDHHFDTYFRNEMYSSDLDHIMGTQGITDSVLRRAVDHTFVASDHRGIILDIAIKDITTQWSETAFASTRSPPLPDETKRLRCVNWDDYQKHLTVLEHNATLVLKLSSIPEQCSVQENWNLLSDIIRQTALKVAPPPSPPPAVEGLVVGENHWENRVKNTRLRIARLVFRYLRYGNSPEVIREAKLLKMSDASNKYDTLWLNKVRWASQPKQERPRGKLPLSENKLSDETFDSNDHNSNRVKTFRQRILRTPIKNSRGISSAWVPTNTLKDWSGHSDQEEEITREPEVVRNIVHKTLSEWMARGARLPCPGNFDNIMTGDMTTLSDIQRRLLAPITTLPVGIWNDLLKPIRIKEINDVDADDNGSHSHQDFGSVDWQRLRARGNVSAPRDTSPGSDDLRLAWFTATDEGCNAICNLFNKIFSEGTLPSQWFDTIISLVPKDSDLPVSMTNARPVSLLNECRKALEAILERRIATVLQNFQILNSSQHMALSRDMDEAIHLLRTFFEEANSTGTPLSVAYIDIEKCHDSFPFWVSAMALKRIGMSEKEIRFILLFIQNRHGRAKTAYGLTDTFDFLGGVAQGSPLSAIIWSIVFDTVLTDLDRHRHLFPIVNGHRLTPIAWADDLAMATATTNGMKELAAICTNDLGALGIDVNVPKSTFTTSDDTADRDTTIVINGKSMRRVPPNTAVKHLGIRISLTCDWSAQIAIIETKAARVLYELLSSRCGLTAARYIINWCLIPSIRFSGRFIATPLFYNCTQKIDRLITNLMWSIAASGEHMQAPIFSHLGADINDATNTSTSAFIDSVNHVIASGGLASDSIVAQISRITQLAMTPGSVTAFPNAFNQNERRFHSLAYACIRLQSLNELTLDIRGLDVALNRARSWDIALCDVFTKCPTERQLASPLTDKSGRQADIYRTWLRQAALANRCNPSEIMWLGRFVAPDGIHIGALLNPNINSPSSRFWKTILNTITDKSLVLSTAMWGLTQLLPKFRIGHVTAHHVIGHDASSVPTKPPALESSLAIPRRIFLTPADTHCYTMGPLSSTSPTPLDHNRVASTVEWMSENIRDYSIAEVETHIKETPYYTQIHSDGSYSRGSGGTYGAMSLRVDKGTVSAQYRAAAVAHAESAYNMETAAPIDAMSMIPTDTIAVDFFSDCLSWLRRADRLLKDWKQGMQPPLQQIAKWADRVQWSEFFWQCTRLKSSSFNFHHVPGHHFELSLPVVANHSMDRLASLQYDTKTPHRYANAYFHPFELRSAICSKSGAIPGRPFETLRLARNTFWVTEWAKLNTRGEIARRFLQNLYTGSVSDCSWSISSIPAIAKSTLLTRTRMWWTTSRVWSLPVTDRVCPSCSLHGERIYDNTIHSQTCPHDIRRRSSHLARWYRRLENAAPGFCWKLLTFRPITNESIKILNDSLPALPNTVAFLTSPFMWNRAHRGGVSVHVTDDLKPELPSLLANISPSRIAWLARASNNNGKAIIDCIRWGLDPTSSLLKNGWTTPTDLMRLLVDIWNVKGELCSCALNASPLLEFHVSGRKQDTDFGMIYDIFSMETETLIRNNPGITWLLNPPYNEGNSGASATIMDRALVWVGLQIEMATAEDRDLAFIMIVPYKRGSPAYNGIQQLGTSQRLILSFAANSCLSFESGLAWRSSDSDWKGGRPSKAEFRVGLVEVASNKGKERLTNTFSSINGAKLYQFAAANNPRGGVSGISLPSSVWPPLTRKLWNMRSKESDWVASCHGLPIGCDFNIRNFGIMLAASPSPAQLSQEERNCALKELCAAFDRPFGDWALGLLPIGLERILRPLGLGFPDTWRRAITALRDFWDTVSRDRRAISTLEEDVRQERRVSRQRRFCASVSATLHVTEAQIINRAARRYGVDRGRPGSL